MKFVIYRDSQGDYRWRLLARNGKTIADSGEGYANESNARRAAKRLLALRDIEIHAFIFPDQAAA